MKRLRIFVLNDSALDIYLSDCGFIYENVVRLSNKTSYAMNISKSLELIDFLVSKFCLNDFQIKCHDGVVTFRVRS